MVKRDIKILTIGDVHLNHKNTCTKDILKSLINTCSGENLSKIDLLIIEGDFFDGIVALPNINLFRIKRFILNLLKLCVKHNVILRVLEGTPSHDWLQSNLFIMINEISNINCNVRHVTNVEIEIIDSLGLSILYIPDEWKGTTDETWKDVKIVLSEKHLKRVDIVVMHGAFEHQLPPHVNSPTHSVKRYNSIINYLVFVGHVHKYSHHKNILATGSLDRLSHGEEEPKGYTLVTLFKEGNYEVKFIENKLATIYKTIDCTDLDIDKALESINNLSIKIKRGNIRVQADKDSVIFESLKELNLRYPEIRFKKKINKTEVSIMSNTFKPKPLMVINKSNIKDLILKELDREKFDLRYASEVLGEAINGV